jgi:hypothetical protein
MKDVVHMHGGLVHLKNATYAYVSDLIRLLALKDLGGVYMDHDVAVIKDFSELLEGKSVVMTFMYDSKNQSSKNTWNKGDRISDFQPGTYSSALYNSDTVNNCFIAAEPNHPLINRMIELTIDNHFRDSKDQYAMSDWGAGPAIASAACREFGLNIDSSQTVEKDGIIVYERSLLHPINGTERARDGAEVYSNKVDKLLEGASESFTVHTHDHFGTDTFLSETFIPFDRWYADTF